MFFSFLQRLGFCLPMDIYVLDTFFQNNVTADRASRDNTIKFSKFVAAIELVCTLSDAKKPAKSVA